MKYKPKAKFRKSRCFCGRKEWYYSLSGFPPPHERTTSSSGPFRTRKAAERDAERQIKEHMRVWKKAKAAGNPNCT